jgi:hypothetical protein
MDKLPCVSDDILYRPLYLLQPPFGLYVILEDFQSIISARPEQ